LRSAIGSSAEKIHVSVRKGEVTLKGSLPASVDRQALLDQLEKLPGVDQIEDRLQVSR
jgi:osmotically-inducible protein OsmY